MSPTMLLRSDARTRSVPRLGTESRAPAVQPPPIAPDKTAMTARMTVLVDILRG